MNKKVLIGAVATIAIVGLGLGFMKSKESKGDVSSNETITITHKLGNTEVVKNPQRVVSFDYGIVDSLDELGIEVVGLPKDGVPEYLNKFNDKKYVHLGGLKEPNMEKLFEAKPDLIIISGRLEEMYGELSKIAPTVFIEIDNENYIESFKGNMNTLADIFGKEKEVKTLLADIDSNIEEVKAKTAKIDDKALITMVNDGSVSAYGANSRFGIIHNTLGVKEADMNIEGSSHGQKISFEYIVDLNPQYLFVVDRGAIAGGQSSAKQVLENELIKTTDVYKNGKIVYLDPQVWYTAVGGFTSTAKMIEEVNSGIK